MAVLTSRRRYSNVAPQATLLAPLNASATTFGISTGTGFPAVPFTAALDYQSPGEEVILVTGLSGTTVTGCTRGYDGSSAQSHSTGALFVHVGVAKDYDEANDHTSSTAAHGTAGAVVGTTDTQTLTNKTISSSKGLATATDQALRLQAAASGVASLLEGLDSAGTVLLFKVGRGGDTFINPNDSSKKPLVVKGAVGQSVNIAEFQDSNGVLLLILNQAGRLTQKPTDLAGPAWKYVPPSSSAGQFLALRNTGDSADLFVLTTLGELTNVAKVWAAGISTDDPFRFPLDGSLFKVDASGNVTAAGNLTADSVITQDVVRKVAYASSTATPATTATEGKDTGIGDLVVTTVAGRKYRVVYHARAESVSGTNSIDFRIRDGGASSPTTGSTQIAGASAGTIGATGAETRELRVDQYAPGLSSGGTHTIAAFAAMTTGSGSIRCGGNASGQLRELVVYEEGTV